MTTKNTESRLQLIARIELYLQSSGLKIAAFADLYGLSDKTVRRALRLIETLTGNKLTLRKESDGWRWFADRADDLVLTDRARARILERDHQPAPHQESN